MSETLPFDHWPSDHFEKTYQAEDALGTAFVTSLKMQMQFIKKKCAALAPELTNNELESVVQEAAFGGVYALLMVLDGGESQSVEVPMESGSSITLSSFRPNKTECVETVEVLPGGDGLCYAYHAWKDTYNSDKQPEERNG